MSEQEQIVDQEMDQELSYEDDHLKDENYSQFLSFILGADVYGISVDNVKEVIEYTKVFNVPRVPIYIRGVLNLRGEVIPVIDLYSRFFDKQNEVTSFTSIIVAELEDEGEYIRIGIVIDAVKEVVDILEENIEDTPSFGLNIKHEFVSGVGKVNDDFIILLDIKNVLNLVEISNFEDSGITGKGAV